MKKLLFLLLIMFLFSCEKKEENCKICETITTVTPNYKYSIYEPVITRIIFEACGEHLKEINGEDITAPASIHGYPATMTRKTKCY